MKKLKLSVLALIPFIGMAQTNKCEEPQFSSMAISYVFPQGLGAEGGLTFDRGVIHTANIGIAYQTPKYHSIKKGNDTIDSLGNVLDIYTYVGWRLYRRDFKLSIYGNVGWTFGDAAGIKPLASIKFLIPINETAVSVEPFYILGRSASIRLSIHFKI